MDRDEIFKRLDNAHVVLLTGKQMNILLYALEQFRRKDCVYVEMPQEGRDLTLKTERQLEDLLGAASFRRFPQGGFS